jgi:hypothetical protein
VQEAVLIAVLVMAVASDANQLAVQRARKAALTSARHTVEANVAYGDIQVLSLDLVACPVTVLQEAREAYVFTTTRCWMTIVFMGVCHLVLSVLSAVHFLMEMVLQALKQAGKAYSCTLQRLLVLCLFQLLRVACMVLIFCQCLLTV